MNDDLASVTPSETTSMKTKYGSEFDNMSMTSAKIRSLKEMRNNRKELLSVLSTLDQANTGTIS